MLWQRPLRVALALTLSTAFSAACSDDAGGGSSDDDQDLGADVDDDGAGDADDQGGPIDQGQPDQAQPDQAQPDQAQPDQAQPDEGQPDQGQPDLEADPVEDLPQFDVVDPGPTDCEVDTSGLDLADEYSDGAGGMRQAMLAIEAVDFVNDVVYIRNLSHLTGTPRPVEFDSDWRLAHNISGAALTPARDLPPGGRMAIHLRETGFNTPEATYLNLGGGTWNLAACGGEIVIQNRTEQIGEEWSNNPGNIEAYVRWGNRTTAGATATFNDEAFDAGAWDVDWTETSNAIQTCWGDDEGASWCDASPTCEGMANHAGLVATGEVEDPFSWVSASTADFADCP